MHFIGPDSDKALRAVYAAGLQGHLWEALDLLYKSQGAENSGWVTDDLLRSVGASIPGFDTEKMFADMSSPEVDRRSRGGRPAGAEGERELDADVLRRADRRARSSTST